VADAREAARIGALIASIDTSGFTPVFGGKQVVLKPSPELRREYGMVDDATFSFPTLEEAAGWARGWVDHRTYWRLGKTSSGKRGKRGKKK
jgi:hypothetical protein